MLLINPRAQRASYDAALAQVLNIEQGRAPQSFLDAQRAWLASADQA